MNKLIESLSPIERKIIPFLNLQLGEIIEKSSLDKTTVLRALDFLQKKDVLRLKTEEKEIIDLGVNGIRYKKNHLPERQLISFLESKKFFTFSEAKSLSKLSDNEFKVSLGVLKNKSLIEINNGKISLTANKESLTKKLPEEKLLEALPAEKNKLNEQDLAALESLSKRKDIIEIRKEKTTILELTETGKNIAGKEIKSDFVEEITSEIIKSAKQRKFRRYDLQAKVPSIYGGKKHFVNQSIEYAKRIWLDFGFKEMSGAIVQTSFWNFDALFTPQDHPTRELHDTFFLKDVEGKLPDKTIVTKVKEAHEKGTKGSKGWNYQWNENEAKRVVLRTHTTCISAQTLVAIKKNLPAKYFTIGKNFRNETVDWSHGFEFYQTEGIVVDKNANFRQLLSYLKKFYEKMGFDKVRFTPSYFPYTEPSVEISVFHPERKAHPDRALSVHSPALQSLPP